MQHHDNNYNVTENTTDSSEDKEQAIITLKYAGLESIPERDVITFFNLETAEILGIAATDKEKRNYPFHQEDMRLHLIIKRRIF